MQTEDSSEPHLRVIDPSRRMFRRVAVPCAVAAVILGTIGNLQYQHDEHEATSVANALYHTLQLFAMHTPLYLKPIPWTLEAARWLAPLATLISLWRFVASFVHSERAERRLRRIRGHSVVCGLGRKGLQMVRYLRQRGREVVVIEMNPNSEYAEACNKLGALVLTGNAEHREVLLEARVQVAAEIYVLCPEDQTNCEIAAVASQVPRAGGASPLDCHVHLGDVELRQLLQERLVEHSDSSRVRTHFFDVFDPVGRRLLMEGLPLDHVPISRECSKRVHVVLLGLGRMGRRLAVRAAQLGHFANGAKLRLSIIDRNGTANLNTLLFRYPALKEVCEVELHEQELLCPETDTLVAGWLADPNFITSLVVCMDDEPRGLEVGLRFLPMAKRHSCRIALRMAREGGLARLLECGPGGCGTDGPLRVYGLEEEWCELMHPETDVCEKLAAAIHEAYRTSKPPTNGNPQESMQPWAQLKEQFRESSRQQASHIPVKLRAIGCEPLPADKSGDAVMGFTPEQVELLARMEHARWVAERRMAGCRYGVRDDENLLHPDLMDWDAGLKEESRELDRVAVRQIPALLGMVGMKACRKR